MKEILLILIVGFSITIQAQNVFDTKSNRVNKEQDLMNFIRSDIDLYEKYVSGKANLNVAKGIGHTALGFLGGGVVLIGSAGTGLDGIGQIVIGGLSMTLGSILGIVGTIMHYKGKGKVRDVMDYAQRKNRSDYGSSIELNTTSNGVGFVYSF